MTYNVFSGTLNLTHSLTQHPKQQIGSAVFAQVTAESPYTLQWAPLFLFPKITPSHGDVDPI